MEVEDDSRLDNDSISVAQEEAVTHSQLFGDAVEDESGVFKTPAPKSTASSPSIVIRRDVIDSQATDDDGDAPHLVGVKRRVSFTMATLEDELSRQGVFDAEFCPHPPDESTRHDMIQQLLIIGAALKNRSV